MTEAEITGHLARLGGFYGIAVPQFTFGNFRLDLALIDIQKRWVRGFEIKLTRSDYLRDEKWERYAEFTSSLSIACPEGLIDASEVAKPFGLLWVTEKGGMQWKRKPVRFQKRGGLAWLHTYVKVIEAELPRLKWELEQAKLSIMRLSEG